jgi:hypothetical protein
MACGGCAEMLKQKAGYDNQKQLAERYSKSEGVLVILYRTTDGLFHFIEATAPEAATINPFEYISPLQ